MDLRIIESIKLRVKKILKFYKNDFFYKNLESKIKMECSICFEDFNSKLKSIQCPANEKCPLVCTICFLKFATDNLVPSCMHCKSEITKDFIRSILNKKKFSEYEKSKFLVMFDRQKSLLPQTADVIEKEKEISRLNYELYENKRLLILTKISKKMFKAEHPKILKPTKKNPERLVIYNNYNKLVDTEKTLKENIINLHHLISSERNKGKQVVKKEFIMSCPLDGCRGFLSSAYKCGLCENYFCNDCNHKKDDRNDEKHVCDENDKATVAFLKKQTKKCPKCGVHISKIDGCDQMYCVAENCMTFFSWTTGKIDEGPRHNPEYFRFLRERGLTIPPSQPNGNNGNECVNYFTIHRINRYYTYNNLRYSFELYKISYKDWEYYYRQGVEIVTTIIDLPTEIGNIDGERLRKRYLLKEIGEDKWKKDLKRIIKKNEKNYEIRQLLELYTIGLNENFKQVIINLRQNKEKNEGDEKKNQVVDDFKMGNDGLSQYINLEIEKVLKKYDSVDRKFIIR